MLLQGRRRNLSGLAVIMDADRVTMIYRQSDEKANNVCRSGAHFVSFLV